jgi:hypothetical protein
VIGVDGLEAHKRTGGREGDSHREGGGGGEYSIAAKTGTVI